MSINLLDLVGGAAGWRQNDRLLRLTTPAGADVLLAETASIEEALGPVAGHLPLLRPFAPNRQLLWPLLTSRSMSPRRPFRHKARSPQVRTHSFSAQPPDLRHFALITRALRFIARSPRSIAPSIRFLFIGSQITLHASFPHSVTLMQLRFASFAVINLRRDLHPQECARAGRTRKRPPGWGGRSVCQPPVTWPACLNPKCWRTGSRSRRTAEFPDPRRRLAWHRCPTSS